MLTRPANNLYHSPQTVKRGNIRCIRHSKCIHINRSSDFPSSCICHDLPTNKLMIGFAWISHRPHWECTRLVYQQVMHQAFSLTHSRIGNSFVHRGCGIANMHGFLSTQHIHQQLAHSLTASTLPACTATSFLQHLCRLYPGSFHHPASKCSQICTDTCMPLDHHNRHKVSKHHSPLW